jgi:hypothetical protein
MLVTDKVIEGKKIAKHKIVPPKAEVIAPVAPAVATPAPPTSEPSAPVTEASPVPATEVLQAPTATTIPENKPAEAAPEEPKPA